jgi:hypothetical protein
MCAVGKQGNGLTVIVTLPVKHANWQFALQTTVEQIANLFPP